MFMQYNKDFGIANSFQVETNKIGYIKSFRIKHGEFFVPSTGTSISNKKKLCILKAYNEFLERFRLGIGSKEITYGKNNDYGMIDTTGTASGNNSENIIKKANLELIEKNELYLFWYTNSSEYVLLPHTSEIKSLIKKLNFQGERHLIFYMKNISNAHTILSVSFKEGILTGCGISGDLNFKKALKSSILENKLIEWENYQNPNSDLYHHSINEKEQIQFFFNEKIKETRPLIINNESSEDEDIIYKDWIDTPQIILLNTQNSSFKTIKLISNSLLNCIPNNYNLNNCLNQKIIELFPPTHNFNCLLV
ncbi:YcaO-like family protein [Kurthia sibirica]|uniref:YcaO domain-containing protein n=1 Tax=Kurthia sibirica TaxID=202750 RepID=A0A2U3AEQ0_9BACL|nr:YcaO-like family protein [Kurthia sibirica]PWI23019.1 hypothetical protein DEX24_16520 [Kurthia sibirica]GEK35600.1 hypothetical protein KSI01_31330 [Kurthia sibirica]